MLSARRPASRHDGEGLGQEVVERLAGGAAAARNSAVFAAELLVGQRARRGLERVDGGDERREPLQFAFVLGADDLGEEHTKHVRRAAMQYGGITRL